MNDAASSLRDGTTRGPWMTPAQARQLAAAAGDLYHQLREADLARDADPRPGSAARRLAAGRRRRRSAQRRRGAAGHRRRAHQTGGPADRRLSCAVGRLPRARSDAAVHRRALLVHRPRLPPPVAAQPRRAVRRTRSPTASSTPTAISSTSATVTPPTHAPASSAPRSSRGSDGRRHRSSVAAGAGHRRHDRAQARRRGSRVTSVACPRRAGSARADTTAAMRVG